MASVSDFQRNYPALIRKVKTSREPLLVLRQNKPQAVLLDTDLFQEMAEKIIAFEEEQALKAIMAYQTERKEGKLKKLKRAEELFE